MSTTGTEKHCRLCLMLSKGGTKACHHLFLKRVKELSPINHQPYPWTIQQFLEHNRKTIKKSKISKKKFDILFPCTGDTDLSKWDLSLYCTVLMLYCELSSIVNLDIKQFQTLRNELCHMNEPNITNPEFKDKLEMVKVVVDRILKEIDDKNVKLEIEKIMQSLENEPLSLEETLKEMHKFYLMEIDIREKLEHVEEKVLQKLEQLDDKCELINNKIDHSSSAKQDMARNNVLVPGVDIFLDLENVSEDEEENMSEVLCKLFEEIINEDNGLKYSIPADSHVKLREVSKKTFQLFLSKGWKIVSAKKECIQLHIQCNSFKALACLFREQISGQIDEQLADLNEALNECILGRNSSIETTIYKDEFWNVLEKSICSVEEVLTKYNVISTNTNKKGQPCPGRSRHTLTLTARNVRPDCEQFTIDRDRSNELETCLVSLKTDLKSEFSDHNFTIKIRNWAKIDHHNVETGQNTEDEIEMIGSEKNTLVQTIDKLENLSLEYEEPQERFDKKSEEEVQSFETYTQPPAIKQIESRKVTSVKKDDVTDEVNKVRKPIEKTFSDRPMRKTSSYLKEQDTASAELKQIKQQNALKGIYKSSIAVSCYCELTILTLLDTRLHQKVIDAIQRGMNDVTAIYQIIKRTAKHLGHDSFSQFRYHDSRTNSTIKEIEGTIDNISRLRKSVKSTILELESRLKIKEPTIQVRKEEKESIYHLQKQCEDEERLTREWHRDLKETFELYQTNKIQRTEDFGRYKDMSYGKQYSKKTHVDYDRKPHYISEFTTSLKPDVVRSTEIKQSLVDDRTKEELLIITSEEAIRKEMLSKPLTMHQYPPHVKYSNVKQSHMDDLVGGIPIHEMLTETLSKMLQPGPALFSKYSDKYMDFQRETSVHTILFSDPLFESNADFLKEVKAFYSELTKAHGGGWSFWNLWTWFPWFTLRREKRDLQLQSELISHRCMQRIKIHLEKIDVQLKRITNTLSRINMAVEKIEEDRDVFSSWDFSDVRQEWQQVVDDKLNIYIWLLTNRLLNLPSFGQLSREERNRKIRNMLQDNERL